MNSAPPYSTAAIRKFSSTVLRPRLASNFVPYHGNRDLVRQQSNFVQLIALSGGRYGETLKVLPTFYVVGAFPSDEVIPQSVALSAENPSRWRFQGRHLDKGLADDICNLLRENSPVSFFAPVGEADIVSALKRIAANATSEDAPLFLAFYMMANGISGQNLWLETARRTFLKRNPEIHHDWQRTALQRIEDLEQRLGAPDATIVCQKEAQDQALRLKLPGIEWSKS